MTQFFPQIFTSWFLCCDSNLHIQNNLPRLGTWLIDLTSFFLSQMLDNVLEHWKLSKLYFIIEKTFGLLELYVIVKGITSSFLAVFGCLKISRGISLALNKLVCISDLGYFCSSNAFFNSLKHFSFTFSFSTMAYILLAIENGISVKKCHGCFDVNVTYRFESVGLL